MQAGRLAKPLAEVFLSQAPQLRATSSAIFQCIPHANSVVDVGRSKQMDLVKLPLALRMAVQELRRQRERITGSFAVLAIAVAGGRRRSVL